MKNFILMMAFSLILSGIDFVLAEDLADQSAVNQTAVSPEIVAGAPADEETDLQWVWGEVVSLGPDKAGLLVKYIDYDTDSEKEIVITLDKDTTYENVQSPDQIKPQDMVSIDYRISPEGKNIAKNISVEKENLPSAETTPSVDLSGAATANESAQTAPASQ